ncbi:MAG: response regulator [Gemmatimonadota bacterium]|nr:response regulator [Gemmatimonadota bacterium]
MNAGDLQRRLLATFRAELEQQLRAMNADLLALERSPTDPARLKALFRGAHTLKGAARAVGDADVERTCHELETRLAEARDGKRPLGTADVARIFATLDSLAESAGAGARVSKETGALAPSVAEKSAAATWSAGPTASTSTEVGHAGDETRADSVLRLEASKVDALLASVEEVMLDRSRVSRRREQAHDLQEAVGRSARDWRVAARSVRLALARSGMPQGQAADAFTGDGTATAAAERAMNELEETLRHLARDSARLASHLERDATALGRSVDVLAGRAQRVRVRPFREACEGLPRAVRDVAVAAGKDVALRIEGGDVEADRAVLDGLRDALVPLIRNAVDHGIEPTQARTAAGKPAQGTITVSAALQGDAIVVTVADDGAGMDVKAIATALRAAGMDPPTERRALARALVAAGVTTRAQVTAISGRGVGLDIVREAVDRIRGALDVDFEPGGGTTFRITCPPTLSTLRAVLVTVGGHAVAIPSTFVARVMRVQPPDIRSVQGQAVLATANGPVPVAPLARLLGPPFAERALTGPSPAVLLARGDDRLAVLVDQLDGEQEVVLRPIDAPIAGRRLAHGAAILGTGRVAVVVDAAALAAAGAGAQVEVRVEAEAPEARRARIIVVDDSITTRALEQSVLEAAGYLVHTAPDGADAWRLLQERGADLVVSDIEMPRMDGFDLTAAIRASQRFRELPVVLVTALENDAHRRRGLEVGASAYIGKSGFDQQNLLDTIAQLLD